MLRGTALKECASHVKGMVPAADCSCTCGSFEVDVHLASSDEELLATGLTTAMTPYR